jgi:hypothetical protein
MPAPTTIIQNRFVLGLSLFSLLVSSIFSPFPRPADSEPLIPHSLPLHPFSPFLLESFPKLSPPPPTVAMLFTTIALVAAIAFPAAVAGESLGIPVKGGPSDPMDAASLNNVPGPEGDDQLCITDLDCDKPGTTEKFATSSCAVPPRKGSKDFVYNAIDQFGYGVCNHENECYCSVSQSGESLENG